ncbi:MAG TPA: cyclic nucleotide-binding domain-containing protein [Prolixibacteraceae bacterium]|nr:cyclic nucleotide-binding domain-containing protein [Prolixibacteraceae bacterium]
MNFAKSVLVAQVLNKSAALDESEIDLIAPLFQTVCLRAGDFFIQEGGPIHKVAFVVSGILRRYTTIRQGLDIVLQFICEDHFFGDIDGYYKRKPSKANVQAITNCHLLTIQMDDLDRLKKEDKKFAAIIRFISEEAINERLKTETLINEGSPYEKYQHFLAHYSKWASRIPLKDIASYLQIRPGTLSYIGNQQL